MATLVRQRRHAGAAQVQVCGTPGGSVETGCDPVMRRELFAYANPIVKLGFQDGC
jgi:hypothetical protein